MSIISVRSLFEIEEKTLIYFTKTVPLHWIPQSYIYYMSDSLSELIRDISKFNIQNYHIICYDDEDMSLSSTAYWIFKSIGYDVIVLYGGLKACEEEGILLTNLTPETIPFLEDSQQIDLNILSKDENNVLVIKDLPFALYEVLGEEITQKKLKKLLKIHKIEYNLKNSVLAGKNAAIFGLILKYLNKENIGVYLGEWEEKKERLLSVKPETFYTVAESLYFDAFEGYPSEKDDTREIIAESVTIDHYSVPLLGQKKTITGYKFESSSDFSCRRCSLL